MTEEQRQTLIKDATYKKDLKISYFNSLNAAISLVGTTNFPTDDMKLEAIEKYKNHFLEKWGDYYSNTVLQKRVPYNPADTIKKINEAKNYEDLKKVWFGITADERANPLILKAKENHPEYKKITPLAQTAPVKKVVKKKESKVK
jgi:hypothetical protein